MFTVLGTWEVIGEVQGERYTAINIDSSGRCEEWGVSEKQYAEREKCERFHRKSPAAASDHRSISKPSSNHKYSSGTLNVTIAASAAFPESAGPRKNALPPTSHYAETTEKTLA